MKLSEKEIKAAPKGAEPLDSEEAKNLLGKVSSEWHLIEDGKKLKLSVKTEDFSDSLNKAQTVGKMANEVWHHPELGIAFKRFTVEITTHDVGGLREEDFIFAAKVDDLLGLS